MRTLIVSDIHSNLEALEAVLEEPHDRVVFLGDLVDYGPNPKECLNLIKQSNLLGAVKGNHDHAAAFNVSDRCSPEFYEMSVQTRAYTRENLDKEELEFLGLLSTEVKLKIDGLDVLLVHASPRDHMYKYFTPDMSDEELAMEMQGVQADVVMLGHSHLTFIRKSGEITVVNPGSVGQSRVGEPETCYVVFEDGKIELKQKPYDYKKTVKKIHKMSLTTEVKQSLTNLLSSHK